MTKDLIKIIDNNLQHLKSCLDLTEAHITWGTKDVKEKYSTIKERILMKIQEEKVYRRIYSTNPPVVQTNQPKKTYSNTSKEYFKQKYKGTGYKVTLLTGETLIV
tara:strand:- start:81 stop:395 length:315 start_codon:yes stop_codon:yes gene_type:complete